LASREHNLSIKLSTKESCDFFGWKTVGVHIKR